MSCLPRRSLGKDDRRAQDRPRQGMAATATATAAAVLPLTWQGDEAALVRALRAGHPGAAEAFYDRHANHVLRTLYSVLGADDELPDLLQEVFIRAFGGIRNLREIERVRAWLTKIAIWVGGQQRRTYARRNRLRLYSPEHTRIEHCEQPSLAARRSVQAFYEALDGLPARERTAFTLRFVDGMTLPAAAEACQTSLSTFKRRLARAQNRFMALARKRPDIEDWFEGNRWRRQCNRWRGQSTTAALSHA